MGLRVASLAAAMWPLAAPLLFAQAGVEGSGPSLFAHGELDSRCKPSGCPRQIAPVELFRHYPKRMPL